MLEPLPRKPRNLSRFMCEELLYEFLNGTLDEDRRSAVERYIQANPEMNFELKALASAKQYCERLAEARISPGQIEELRKIRPPTEGLAGKLKWSAWPEFLKWTMEAFMVSTAVAAIALVIPWHKLSFEFPKGPKTEETIIISESKRPPVEEQKSQPAEKAAEKQEKPGTPAKTSATVAATPAPADDLDEDVNEVSQVAAKAPSTATTSSQRVIPLKGMVYRLMMGIPNTEVVSEDIKLKILELGGAKAGQVELGWRKKDPLGSYFHFTMPEANYDALMKSLEGYGSVRVYKNPHSRVMPEGTIRIILWVEEKGSPAPENKVETAPATPTAPQPESEPSPEPEQ